MTVASAPLRSAARHCGQRLPLHNDPLGKTGSHHACFLSNLPRVVTTLMSFHNSSPSQKWATTRRGERLVGLPMPLHGPAHRLRSAYLAYLSPLRTGVQVSYYACSRALRCSS